MLAMTAPIGPNRLAAICTLLLASLGLIGHCAATAAADAPGKHYVPPASYAALYAEILASHSPGRPAKLQDALSLGGVAALLAEYDSAAAAPGTAILGPGAASGKRSTDAQIAPGQKALREQAVAYFNLALAEKDFGLRDFHVLVAFGRLAKQLDVLALLTPDARKRVQSLAAGQAKNIVASDDDSDNNIRLAQMLGSAYLKPFIVDAAQREALEKRLDRYWRRIAATSDLDEDAENYDSLGAVFMVELAEELGRQRDLVERPGFRRLFTRFRDTISPTGLVPEYGDSYFNEGTLHLDRVFLMEYAAGLYRDATFRWAAERLVRHPQTVPPPADLWCRGLGLIPLAIFDAPPTPPSGEPSLVTYRTRPHDASEHVDKLILRTGCSPGDAMVFFDLYASGSHSHPEKGPSLAYYEVGGAPLFHNLGRHRARSAITGNLLWALPPGQRFPGCWNRSGEWFTMSIPAERLTSDAEPLTGDAALKSDGKPATSDSEPANGEAGRHRLAPSRSLRNFHELNQGCESLALDNLRLVGPSGVRLIDGFESIAGWDPRIARLTKISVSPLATEGAGSTEIGWRPLPSSEFKKLFAEPLKEPFSAREYTSLKVDLRYLGDRPYAHIRGLGQQVDLGDQLLVSRLRSAGVEQRGRDAMGRIDYDAYIEPGATISRRVLLTAEGWLVIHDSLAPSAAMRDWRSGQLWQLYSLAARGSDWFASDDDGAYPSNSGPWPRRRMLVRFACDTETGASLETIKQAYHCPNPRGRPAKEFFTAFSERVLKPGRTERFTLAVAPLEAGTGEPSDVARQIRFESRADGVSVRLLRRAMSDGGNDNTPRDIVVDIRGDSWSVRRE